MQTTSSNKKMEMSFITDYRKSSESPLAAAGMPLGLQESKKDQGRVKDDRLERAFAWYARMSTPTRTEFKRRVEAMETSSSLDVTPEDVDLLPSNESGRVVNIAKMNAIVRARILKP
jgi:hypothetical protein